MVTPVTSVNLINLDELPPLPTYQGLAIYPVKLDGVTYQQSVSILKSDFLSSPALSGNPTSPTPFPGDNSERIATTEFVQGELSGLGLNEATQASFGTVRTDETEAVPIVYLKSSVDDYRATHVQTVPLGGTGGATAEDALINLGAAQRGSNEDITALQSLASVPLIIQNLINRLIPIGVIDAFSGSVPPTGWLLCDGAAVDRVTYASLFGVIGETFGAGDGLNTFNLPNLQGTFPIGAGTNPVEGGVYALGGYYGEEEHTLINEELPSHTHSGSAVASGTHNHVSQMSNAGGHSHSGTTGISSIPMLRSVSTVNNAPTNGGSQKLVNPVATSLHTHSFSTSSTGSHFHAFSIFDGGSHIHSLQLNDAGNDFPHNNIPPCVAINYIIRYQ